MAAKSSAVLCIKRVKDFEAGIMNRNRFANSSVIFTQNRYYAREFAARTTEYGGRLWNTGSGRNLSLLQAQSSCWRRHCLGRTATASTESKPSQHAGSTEERKKKSVHLGQDNLSSCALPREP